MEACFSSAVGAAAFLLAQAAWADSGVLPVQGASAALQLLASQPAAAGAQAPNEPGLLPVDANAGIADAPAAGEALASPARRPLAFVNTGGASLNIGGLAARSGGVSGAAGAYQYVQAAGGAIAIYRKEDGVRILTAASASSLFAGAPSNAPMHACRLQPAGDAAVHHDHLAMRWIVSYRAGAPPAQYQCLAVSASADAGGAYYRYALSLAGPSWQAEDPRMAVWSDGYYFSFARFDQRKRYLGSRLCGVERAALAAGADARYRCLDTGPESGPASPVRLEGYPSAGQGASEALFVSLDTRRGGAPRLYLWRFPPQAGQPARVAALAPSAYAPACATSIMGRCVAQPFAASALPAIGDRIAPGAVYRTIGTRAIVLAYHPVQLDDGATGVRWYQVADPHGDAHIAEQGTLAKAGEHRWMASGGIDRAGNTAFGYSVAAHDTPAGIRYTGREPHDPPGMLQSEEVLVNGAGAITGAVPARLAGQLSLDPSDGCTFWYTQRYVPTSGPDTWRTRIARFRFRSCR